MERNLLVNKVTNKDHLIKFEIRGENMKKILGIGTVFISSLIFIGCQQPTVNTNTNVNTILDNKTNTNVNTNVNSSAPTAGIIETKEPDKYQAKVTLSFEAQTAQKNNMATPPIIAMVARNGSNRRMEFTLPNSEKVVYLEANGKNMILLPGRKQYAELNEQSTGFSMRSMMMPEQIVKQMSNIQGVKKVGEEKFEGRDAVKYAYESMTDTKTQAGKVETEGYFLVDKETSLPLRAETVSESQSGNVQGFKGVKFITQMSDIQTEVPDDLFAEPTGFQKVDEQQVRGQVDLIFSVAMTFLQNIAKTAQNMPNSNTAVNQ